MFFAQLADAVSVNYTLNPAGWAFMLISTISVLGLSGWCLFRTLSLPPKDAEEHLKSPHNIDPGDSVDAD